MSTRAVLKRRFSSSGISKVSLKDMVQEAWDEHMRRQKLLTDKVAAEKDALTKVADADVAKRAAEIAAMTAEKDADVAKRAAEIAALTKVADADVAKRAAEKDALTKVADADVAKKAAETAALKKAADDDTKTKEHKLRFAKYRLLGSVGIVTVASLYLWLDWLYYDSSMGLKWHIKRFLKKSNKYDDPRKDNNLLAKILPVRLIASTIDLSDVFAKDNEARVLTTLDTIRGKQFPYMLIAPTGQGKSTLLKYFAYLLSAHDRPTAYIGFRIADNGKKAEASAASALVSKTDVAPAVTGAAQTASQTEKPLLLSISEQLCKYLKIPLGQSVIRRIRRGKIFNISVDGDIAQYRDLTDIIRLLFEASEEIYEESKKQQKVLLIFDEVLDLTRPSRAGSPSGEHVFKRLCERVRVCTTDQHNISIMFSSSSSFLPIALEGTVSAACEWRRLSIKVEEKDVFNYLKGLNYHDDQIARIISLYDVRLRYLTEFSKQELDQPAEQQSAKLKTQLVLLTNSLFTPLQQIVKLDNAYERSKLIKAIDRLAANEKSVLLTDLPKVLQRADAITRIMYLQEDETLRFQIPAFGEIWRARRREIK